MLVIRPADSAETSVAWKMAMENTETPTALILSRQTVNDIHSQVCDTYEQRYQEALGAQRGGYIVARKRIQTWCSWATVLKSRH